MFFNLKKNKFNTYFKLCIILILILIAIIIVYSYLNKKNAQINEKFAAPYQDNEPIYELPLNTTLANLPMFSRFYLDLILDDIGDLTGLSLEIAQESTLNSSSCWSSPIKDFSKFDQSNVNMICLELPTNSAVAGIAIMSCADDPTKYIKTFMIGYMTSMSIETAEMDSYNDNDGNALIFNTNLTGQSNETSYILLPLDIITSLLSKKLLVCLPLTWSSQPAWRIDLLLNDDPKTTQNQQTPTTTQFQTSSTQFQTSSTQFQPTTTQFQTSSTQFQASSTQFQPTTTQIQTLSTASTASTTTNPNSMSENIPLTTYGYNIPKNQSKSSPETEIYQHNFEGTSNVYSPAIYYNTESFDPLNLYDAKFAKY
jgi:hypothetical protein